MIGRLLVFLPSLGMTIARRIEGVERALGRPGPHPPNRNNRLLRGIEHQGAIAMGNNSGDSACRMDLLTSSAEAVTAARELGDTRLLLNAFETFTQASSSLESAFRQLQARTRRLSEELARKNRQLKKSLREKEEVKHHLEMVLANLPCGVLALDDGGGVTLCNPAAAEILGLPKAKSPGQREAHAKAWETVMREGMEELLAQPDGSEEIEIPIVSSGKVKILATSATPLTNAAGRRIGTLIITRDVTEIKALEERNKRGARLSAMGEMAVELAHEIRNPLGSIELFASLLEKELPRGTDSGRWAENIRIGSQSLNNIVSNMLHFANPLSPTFREVNVHEVVEEIMGFADPILSQRELRVDKMLAAEDPLVSGDRELLKQMILNLVLNALQAMPSEGSLIIATRNVQTLPGGAVCDGLEIRIEDSGLGIPRENLDRIFDPFFTTNKSGTGLGLSVVHQIVEQHSGFISVASEPNKGTTFTIIIPGSRVLSGAAEGV